MRARSTGLLTGLGMSEMGSGAVPGDPSSDGELWGAREPSANPNVLHIQQQLLPPSVCLAPITPII